MPSNVVKNKEDEKKWEKAKQIAEDAGQKENYAYIMGIYKKMKPEHFKTASTCYTARKVLLRYMRNL